MFLPGKEFPVCSFSIFRSCRLLPDRRPAAVRGVLQLEGMHLCVGVRSVQCNDVRLHRKDLLVIKVSIRHADDRLQGDLCRDARIEPIRRQGEGLAVFGDCIAWTGNLIVAILRAESRLCRPFFVILSTAEPNVEKSPKCGRYFDIRAFRVNRGNRPFLPGK